jgi:polyhydroxybutyrate depolymerase
MTYSVAILSAILLHGCSPTQEKTAHRQPGRYVETFEIAGKKRDYILRVPKGYDHKKPTPMVVALHGLTGEMSGFERVTAIGEKADQENFIVVIPNGLPEKFRGWNADFFKMAGDKDDVPFLEEVMNRTEKEFNIDRKREFLFGHSNGAMMAYYVGAKLSDRLAAVAGIAGTIGIPSNGTNLTIPEPKGPISVLLIHGQKDAVVAYKPTDKAMLRPIGAVESAQWWAKRNGCPEVPAEQKVSDVATRVNYGKGKNGVVVSLISCMNGTHDVPGGLGESVSGINAVNQIWEFFKANPKK